VRLWSNISIHTDPNSRRRLRRKCWSSGHFHVKLPKARCTPWHPSVHITNPTGQPFGPSCAQPSRLAIPMRSRLIAQRPRFTPPGLRLPPQPTWLARQMAVFSGPICSNPTNLASGSHVCNCGYVVAPEAQGQGIASAMCEHSQREAVAMGFLAMQFNLVVSTNERAVRLWNKLGFSVVGTLPLAFRHQRLGFVDAFVMFKQLAT
jgi:hypothetical protein